MYMFMYTYLIKTMNEVALVTYLGLLTSQAGIHHNMS